MTKRHLPIRQISAVSILVMLAGIVPIAAPLAVVAQDAGEFKVYRLTESTPSEARRMLMELLDSDTEAIHIVADNSASELLVSGSAEVQELADNLVRELNANKSLNVSTAEPRTVKTYVTLPEEAQDQLQLLKRSLSASAKISASEDGRSLVLMGTTKDHKKTADLLEISSDTESPFFGSADNWVRDGSDRESSTETGTREDLQRSRQIEGKLSGRRVDTEFPRSKSTSIASRIPPSSEKKSPRLEKLQEQEHAVRFRFQNITSQQAETAIRRLLGPRVMGLAPRQLSFSSGRTRRVSMTFDEMSDSCLLEGSEDLIQQFAKLMRQLDDARDQKTEDTIRFVSLLNVDTDVLNKALLIWKQSAQRQKAADTGADRKQGSSKRQNFIHRAGFQQAPGEPANPIEQAAPADIGDTTTDKSEAGQDNQLRRPSSDITVEPLPDLDVLILRGRDPDVEELTRIIKEIERLSAETAPEIEVVYLQNVQGEALEKLVTKVLDDLTGPLQGRVSITPLIKPNALLLIGWGEAVSAAKKLIAELDEAVEPQTQMQMFSLKNASANRVETTVKEFLGKRGGLGPTVNITADPRTNTVIVNAAPRDLQEVSRLIERLDAGTSESVNQAKIIQLKNALALDVSQTITAAITAARGGVGTQRSAALEMLLTGPDGKSVAASGLLEDVKLTPDPRTNRIFITGPPESLPLVEQLIESFDESPAASAQIKVFHITNGDASDLVQVLRSLFPEQAAVSNVPQLATAEGETSLVPVRFSVDIRTNTIISTGTSGDLQIVEALLLRLDETDSQERVNEVYRLKNSPALDVANAVNNFLRSERIVNQAAPGRQNPFTQIESEVVVVPEPVGNALIISATPRYFKQILELVKGLDAQPPQVMIQVILAEVSLDNRNEFGVELGLQDSLLFDRSLLGSILTPGYNFNNQPLGNANTANSLASRNQVGGQALSHFSVGRTSSDTGYGGLVLSASSENVSVLLRAMNQTQAVEILSRPQVMTLDNQPAFIQVGQRVPQITGSTISQVGQSNSITPTNVGLILGVTPRISPEGMVVMEIDAEKSEVGPEAEGIPVSISSDGNVVRSPRINITTAQTTVSAASGQTIVIGGLITSSNSSIQRRVPWLSDVPLLGNLFRYDGNANSRKELLIILTPNVVRGRSEAEYIKQVEMARMSWISCDIFNWMNNDCDVAGQLDSGAIPTIYPDQTPGAEAFEQIVPLSSPSVPEIGAGMTYESPQPDPAPPAKVVVPEWKIESSNKLEGDNGIQQMSFSPSELTELEPSSAKSPSTKSGSKRKTETVKPSTVKEKESSIRSEANTKTKPKTKPKSKFLWPLR